MDNLLGKSNNLLVKSNNLLSEIKVISLVKANNLLVKCVIYCVNVMRTQ